MFGLDNLLALIFILIVLTFSLSLGFSIFAYFTMGLLVVRIGEIIFEMKEGLFDRPFFLYLLVIGIPLQLVCDALK